MIRTLVLSLMIACSSTPFAAAETTPKKEREATFAAEQLQKKKDTLALEENVDRVNDQLLVAQRQVQDVRRHILVREKQNKDVTAVQKELDAVQTELAKALDLSAATNDKERAQELTKKQLALQNAVKRLQAQIDALKLGKLTPTTPTAITQSPVAAPARSIEAIKKQADADDKELEKVAGYVQELHEPSIMTAFSKKIHDLIPSRQRAGQVAFLGTGAALLGGIYLTGERPKAAPRIADITDGNRGLAYHAETASRWTRLVSTLSVAAHQVKKTAKQVTGHFGYVVVTDRIAVNQVHEDKRNGIEPVLELSMNNPNMGPVICQYKPGLFATPFKYYEQWRRRTGSQNAAAGETAHAVRTYFGFTPQNLLLASLPVLGPVANYLVQMRSKYGLNGDNTQASQEASNERLETELREYGIPVNDDTKAMLPPDERKDAIKAFLKDAAIDINEKDVEALAALYAYQPAGKMQVELIKSLNACRESQMPVTTGMIVQQACNVFGAQGENDEQRESIIASVAGKTLAAHLYQTNATLIGVTTAKIVNVMRSKNEKGEIAERYITRFGEAFMVPQTAEYTQMLVRIGELKDRIKILIAGKVAQEEVVALGGSSKYDKKDNLCIGIADSDEHLIYHLCLRIAMFKNGFGAMEPTEDLQKKLVLETAAERKELEDIVRADIKQHTRKLQTIFWRLKEQGSMSPQEVSDLMKQLRASEFKSLEHAKASVMRRVRLAQLMHEIKEAEEKKESGDTHEHAHTCSSHHHSHAGHHGCCSHKH